MNRIKNETDKMKNRHKIYKIMKKRAFKEIFERDGATFINKLGKLIS